jgi:hypothetical protein
MLKSATGLVLLLALSASAVLAQTANTKSGADPAGHWEGKIDIPEHPLGMTLDLARDTKGAWIGTMTIAGTTSVDVPLTSLKIDDSTVHFAARLPEETGFVVHLANGVFSGTATNPQGSAPVQLTRSGEAKVNLPAPSSPLSKPFAGEWVGSLPVQGKEIRIGLKLAPAADGTAVATLVSLDQGNAEIPVHTVTIDDHKLALESRSVSGKYSGTLGANGEIAGEWSQGQRTVPLTFKRAAAPAAN